MFKRHLLKTISYRLLGTITTVLISYFSTGSWGLAGTLGVFELTLKPILYFTHERIWYKFIKIGRNENKN